MSAWKWNKNQYKSELDDNKPIEWLEDHHFAVNESRTSQRDMEVKVAAALSSTEISALLDSQDTGGSPSWAPRAFILGHARDSCASQRIGQLAQSHYFSLMLAP